MTEIEDTLSPRKSSQRLQRTASSRGEELKIIINYINFKVGVRVLQTDTIESIL
jgi:hypothetical protein